MQEGTNVIELDFSNKLEITINNSKPVNLTVLTVCLLDVAHQFEKFVEHESNENYSIGSQLYIKEVRSGSIVVELIAQAAPIVPLLWEGGALSEWVNYAKGVVEWLLGRLDVPPKDLSKKDLEQWSNILEPVARDNACQINFTVTDGGQVINQYFFNSNDANAAKNRITQKLEEIDTPNENVHTKKVLYWYQSKFDVHSDTGDKGVIEYIRRGAVKVIFENKAVKEAMLGGDERFHKSWQKLAYVVDVEVQTIRGEPKLYKILRYYPEYTFDPEEQS